MMVKLATKIKVSAKLIKLKKNKTKKVFNFRKFYACIGGLCR